MSDLTTKKRAPNFSATEKSVLLNIIFTFKSVIKNKKTDAVTWRQKDNAWNKITSQFNFQTPENHPRTKESLRKLYDNIKKNVRKDVAMEKHKIIKTGGGPHEKPHRDATTELALGILNEKTVFGLENPYDCDEEDEIPQSPVGTLAGSTPNIVIEEEYDHTYSYLGPTVIDVCEDQTTINPRDLADNFETSCPLELEKNEVVDQAKFTKKRPITKNKKDQKTDWGDYSASNLRTPVTTELKHSWTKRRRPNIQQLSSSQLSEQYLKLAEIKKDFFEAEKENSLRRHQREEELFQLQKKKLELEVKIREEELKKINMGY